MFDSILLWKGQMKTPEFLIWLRVLSTFKVAC
jgi:hypothetical protein